MLKKKLSLVLIVVMAVFFLASCDKESDKDLSGSSTLKVKLTDSPGDYKAVYVDVREIMVYSESDEDSGWVDIPVINPGMYDLLKLTNGVDTLLGENNIPSGYISQIRLILGDDNYLVTEDDSLHLTTPSAQQSGLKVKVDQSFEPNLTYEIILDFDAAKSVVKAGNSGKYILKPVIRTIVDQSTGSLKGIVYPDSTTYAVYAFTEDMDSVGTYTDTTGMFMIKGLEPATYSVYIDPGDDSGLKYTLISGIEVTSGNVFDLDIIELNE